MLRVGAERRLAIGFGIKDFTPEQLKRMSILNPNLFVDLGLEEDVDPRTALAEIQDRNAQTWVLMMLAYQAKGEALRDYEKNRKEKPLATPVQLLGAFIFLVILIRIIGGS